MLCTYIGGDSRSYPDYLNAATWRMLEVTGGGVYDVVVAPGRAEGLPLPPGDSRWIPVPAAAVGVPLPPIPAGDPPSPVLVSPGRAKSGPSTEPEGEA